MKKIDKRKTNKPESPLSKYYREYKLTPRQSDCLRYVTHGMSAKAIGATLGLSVRTIEHNILVLKKKMGCKKKCDLIGKIIIDGMHGAVIAGGRE